MRKADAAHLERVRREHGFALPNACRGWGALRVEGGGKCIDCGREDKDVSLVFEDGRRCGPCGYELHLPGCPVAANGQDRPRPVAST